MTKNTAQTLREKMGLNVREKVTLTVNGIDFTFRFDAQEIDLLMAASTDKAAAVTAIKDYLLAIIEPGDRDNLIEIINAPTVAAQIAAAVQNVFIPKVDIALKA